MYSNLIRIAGNAFSKKMCSISTHFFLQMKEAGVWSQRTVQLSQFLMLVHFIIICRTGCETSHFLQICSRNGSSSCLNGAESCDCAYMYGSSNGGARTQGSAAVSSQRKQRASSLYTRPMCQLELSEVRAHEVLYARDSRSLVSSAAAVCKWGSVEAARTSSDLSASDTSDVPLARHSLAASLHVSVCAPEKR